MENKIHYEGVKSQFISCKKCGSKLASKYIGKTIRNTCPACYTDLRPASTLSAISNAKQKWEKAKAELKKAELKMQKTKESKAKIKWLVKVEYHT